MEALRLSARSLLSLGDVENKARLRRLQSGAVRALKAVKYRHQLESNLDHLSLEDVDPEGWTKPARASTIRLKAYAETTPDLMSEYT